ncbi:MAG: type II secretion system F family protein, partial [bacterium]|nr:type II secretion system F family protein [bacterium]
KFLIFHQQFVTLIKAGLPTRKSLDLLAARLAAEKLSTRVKGVRDEVKTGSALSDAFGSQGVFPPIYVTSVMAGEKSGALAEVLERYINYQRLALSVRKKILVSLMYPALLLALVILLIVFLVTYVVPNFAQLYSAMSAQLPLPTRLLISVGTLARDYVLFGVGGLIVAFIGFRWWSRGERAQKRLDRIKLRTPVMGGI